MAKNTSSRSAVTAADFLLFGRPWRGCSKPKTALGSLAWKRSETKPRLGVDATNSSWPGIVPAIHAVELPHGKTKPRTSLSVFLRSPGSFAAWMAGTMPGHDGGKRARQ
jgi:hypothetical protein